MPPRTPGIDLTGLASILDRLKTSVAEIIEDAVQAGVRRGADGALEVLEQNAQGVVHRISGARGKVRTKGVAAAAPLQRGPEVVVVEGEPRKRKTKRRAKSGGAAGRR